MAANARFEQLVLPHLDAAYNLARWLARNSQDAEDVVQDACVRALKYLDSVRGADAKAWFLTIVRHAFYDWCKHNRPAEIARDDGTAIDMAVDPAAALRGFANTGNPSFSRALLSARHLYESLGFQYEGLMRDAARREDCWCNLCLMSLLESEYKL